MATISNAEAYRFLLEQKKLIEREFMFHYQKHGHDTESCVIKADHRKVSEQLDNVMSGAING